MPDCLPFSQPGQNPTCVANGAVIGCRFVSVKTGVNEVNGLAQVSHTAAAARAFGVSARDVATTEALLVYRSGEVPILCAGALSHGQGVEAGANGVAVPLASGVRLGTVMADAPDATLAHIALELGA